MRQPSAITAPRGEPTAVKGELVVRAVVALTAIVLAFAAVGYYRQWDFVLELWPVPDRAMTHRYFASYIAAFSAALAWVAVTAELAALASIAITVVVGSAALGIFFTDDALDTGSGAAWANAIAFAALLLIGVVVLRWARRLPERQTFRQPRGVRAALLLFITLLILAGGLSVTRSAQVLPWEMTPRWQTTVGILLLSSAVYFTYGYRRGTWAQAGSQLAGFLVYDMILALPYGRLVLERDDPSPIPGGYGTPGNEISGSTLAIVVAVITVSALISAYYLLIDPRTRIWNQLPPMAAA